MELVKPYCDQATLELIAKLLKANYVDVSNLSNISARKQVGTPQGSLISPLLANIYLHELDVFITQELLPMYNKGDERSFVAGYQARKTLSALELRLIEETGIDGLEDAAKAQKHNNWVKDGLGSRDQTDPNFGRLHYVRYADDFLLGFTGTKETAIEINNKIVEFLNTKLDLSVNSEKSVIHHSGDKNIKFLGFFIRYLGTKYTLNKVALKKGIKQIQRIAINQVQLRVPIEPILKRLVDRGFAANRKNGSVRATSCRRLSSLEDNLIVNRYSSIIRGLLNYYKPANQYSDM